jgi:ammonium transporter, Amt family
MKKFIPFGALIFIVTVALVFPFVETVTIANNKIDSGDTAWMLTATALLLIMTPGLAFFYGGMVSKKNVLSTMMQSFVAWALLPLFDDI